MPEPTYAALDLGASSGRVLTGHLRDGRLALREHGRFANRPVRLPDGLRWDLLGLFADGLDALRAAVRDAAPASVGVDTWGVDYALLDHGGRALGLPFSYRDGRGAAEVAPTFARVSEEELYARTGIQHLPFNTVFQLAADEGSPALRAASRLALVPDLLALWLSGELANERTNASTTGLLDARSGAWAHDLIERIGLPAQLFGELVEPGTTLGPALDVHELGGLEVVTVASHDTASAFVAAPVADEHAAILSSGTWSLLGLELDAPVLSEAAHRANLTNERGVDGTTRLLKNVMGLWLEQECARAYGMGHGALHALAAGAPDGGPLFDCDHPDLIAPGTDMPERIAALCVAGGQAAPEGPGPVVRAILESLACKYRYVLDALERVSGREVHRVHVIGGGAQVQLLCRLTAEQTGREVLAGPVEATAMGNVLVQARAAGELGSLSDVRAVARASADVVSYVPGTAAKSAAADARYERFLSVCGLRQQTAPTPA